MNTDVLSAWTVQLLGGYAHWSAPVVLMAHLDAPLKGGLLVEGNLRVEGWAFWIGGEGQVWPAMVELYSQGQRIEAQALQVERQDVNSAHGLPVTAPLGFRIQLETPVPSGELAVVVQSEAGHCTLAKLTLQRAAIDLRPVLEQALQQQLMTLPVSCSQANDEQAWGALLEQLSQGPTWDGSAVVAESQLQRGLATDLELLRQRLGAAQRGTSSGSDLPAGAAGQMLILLARRYGLLLLEAVMDGVNRCWLTTWELELTPRGVKRTFRYWSSAEKQQAMAITSEALELWQAAGIPCCHSFGTLLGLVRESDLLDHDDDINAVALVPVEAGETPEEAIEALEQRLRQLGHQISGHYRFHRHVQHRGVWFDLFVATVREQQVTFWGTKKWTTKLEHVLPLQRRQQGRLISIQPAKPEHVVEGLYGQNWRKPQPYYHTAIQWARADLNRSESITYTNRRTPGETPAQIERIQPNKSLDSENNNRNKGETKEDQRGDEHRYPSPNKSSLKADQNIQADQPQTTLEEKRGVANTGRAPENPAFHVIGAGRSGTSLIAALLNAHPSLEVGLEKYTQEMMTGQDGDNNQKTTSGAEDTYAKAVTDEALRNEGASKRWGNKITTEQLYNLWPSKLGEEDLKTAIENFFGNKLNKGTIIFIIRDGKACVRSKMERAGIPLVEACHRWQRSIRFWETLRETSIPLHTIKFEELVRNPETVLTATCLQLGVEYNPAMLEGTNSRVLLPEYRQSKIDTSKADETTLPREGIEIIKRELEICGYTANEHPAFRNNRKLDT